MNKHSICKLLVWTFAACGTVHATPIERAAEGSMQHEAIGQQKHAHQTWQAFTGQSLRDTVAAWSSKAGYELVWDADYDFPVRAGVSLDGDFIQAVTNLFNAYAAADRPLSVDIYKEQKLLHVQARGE